MKTNAPQLLVGTCLCLFLTAEPVSGLSTRRRIATTTTTTTTTTTITDGPATTIPTDTDRRGFLGSAISIAATITATAATATVVAAPAPANARDELFRPNPLTNPVLEQLRIWEQAEKDTVQYNGELEAGNAGNKGRVDFYPSLLVPILTIDRELTEVRALVRSGCSNENNKDNNKDNSNNDKDKQQLPSAEAMTKALSILQNPSLYEKSNFKKIFNKYGDNIYYSDPDRANLYLGGGATPKTEQSIAYLLRNDVLTNVENLRAELEYLLKVVTVTTDDDDNKNEETPEDLFLYADICTSAMAKYLAQVPPGQMEEARRLLPPPPVVVVSAP